jgi:hypothetical protein
VGKEIKLANGSRKARPGTIWEIFQRQRIHASYSVHVPGLCWQISVLGETITDFIDGLHDRYLSRNTINNYIMAIKPITGCWASPWMT